jgi:hypothetical protein
MLGLEQPQMTDQEASILDTPLPPSITPTCLNVILRVPEGLNKVTAILKAVPKLMLF